MDGSSRTHVDDDHLGIGSRYVRMLLENWPIGGILSANVFYIKQNLSASSELALDQGVLTSAFHCATCPEKKSLTEMILFIVVVSSVVVPHSVGLGNLLNTEKAHVLIYIGKC